MTQAPLPPPSAFTPAAPSPKAHKSPGITRMLIVYLAIFTAFVLLVVWVFQVLLLDSFYRSAKMKELYTTASVIEANIESDTLERSVYSVAGDYAICVLTYRIDGKMATRVLSYEARTSCMIHHIASADIARLYRTALDEGGTYMENVSLDGFHKLDKTDRDRTYGTIYVSVFEGHSGTRYVTLLNAEMTPVNATTHTYLSQFQWIVLLLLCGAVLTAILMSKRLSAPIVRLNRSVKRLAKGDYAEVFDGKGYREIQELSDALNYASGELSRTDRLQKDLLANISHDLRTPLTMIRGYSEMMRDIPGENTPENVQIVIDETTHLSELVTDLLDLSRIQSGVRRANPECFNLTDTVRSTLHRYEKLTEKDAYHISFRYDEDVCIVADKTMMLQVIYNLINNAINYTGDGKTVLVTQTVTGDRVRIAVTDDGNGIAPEDLPSIWDRYYKVDRVHKRAAVGTGLGLSIVKGILEQHMAVYGVDSTPGRGSTFWFEMQTVVPPPPAIPE